MDLGITCSLAFHALNDTSVIGLRSAGFHTAEFKPLLGQSEKTVTRGYGSAPDLPLRTGAEIGAAVAYRELDLALLNAIK